MSAESLRERVAKALHRQVYLNVSLTPPAWEDVAPLTQALFLVDAEAALAEVRAWLGSEGGLRLAECQCCYLVDEVALAALIDQTKEGA